MPSVTTTGAVRLDYTESGPASGRPIVLLAGFRAAAATWLFQVPALAAGAFRVISVDIRGHSVWAYLEQFGSKRLAGVVIVDQTPGMLNTEDWAHGF